MCIGKLTFAADPIGTGKREAAFLAMLIAPIIISLSKISKDVPVF